MVCFEGPRDMYLGLRKALDTSYMELYKRRGSVRVEVEGGKVELDGKPAD
jgi:hypothetical protein